MNKSDMKSDFKARLTSIPSKVFICDFPDQFKTVSRFSGSYTKQVRALQNPEPVHKNDLKRSSRPQSTKNARMTGVIKIPTHRKDYRPISRDRACYTEGSQLSMTKVFVPEENTVSFKYSNRFQKNPKLVYDERRKEYSYIQSSTLKHARESEEIGDARNPFVVRYNYVYSFD